MKMKAYLTDLHILELIYICCWKLGHVVTREPLTLLVLSRLDFCNTVSHVILTRLWHHSLTWQHGCCSASSITTLKLWHVLCASYFGLVCSKGLLVHKTLCGHKPAYMLMLLIDMDKLKD